MFVTVHTNVNKSRHWFGCSVSFPALDTSVVVLELPDKTNSVQTHPPKIATAEKSKHVASANPSKPAGNVKSVIENSALLIFKNPEKFVENYFGQNIGSVVVCQSLHRPSRLRFKALPINLRWTGSPQQNRIYLLRQAPSPSMATSHLLVKFWVARIVKKGSERGVDMLLWREELSLKLSFKTHQLVKCSSTTTVRARKLHLLSLQSTSNERIWSPWCSSICAGYVLEHSL